MDAALAVFSELGARIEEVRMESLQAYYDVKNVITKSEVFALHHRELAQCIENFGSDFLGLTLPGCLYSSADYLHAQTQRSRMVRAMSAIYRKHDVLVTASSGPASARGSSYASVSGATAKRSVSGLYSEIRKKARPHKMRFSLSIAVRS